MKIEKVNENQIRCTLNSSDLHSRNLTLGDLAYGNKKAKTLFAEMMRMADAQFGFRPDNRPLMVEAMPLSSGGLMLLISCVDDPEELDTRFAKFAPGIEEDFHNTESADKRPQDFSANIMETLENILKLGEDKETPAASDSDKKDSVQELPVNIFFVYSFRDLDTVIRAAHTLKNFYQGENRLFKSEEDHRYYLVVHRSEHTPEEFNKVCNILAEYSDRVVSTPGSESYFLEHLDLLIGPQALQGLAQV